MPTIMTRKEFCASFTWEWDIQEAVEHWTGPQVFRTQFNQWVKSLPERPAGLVYKTQDFFAGLAFVQSPCMKPQWHFVLWPEPASSFTSVSRDGEFLKTQAYRLLVARKCIIDPRAPVQASNFRQFQATRRWKESLGEELSDLNSESGFTYLNSSLWIALSPDTGEFWTIVCNEQHSSHDLEYVERELWEWSKETI